MRFGGIYELEGRRVVWRCFVIARVTLDREIFTSYQDCRMIPRSLEKCDMDPQYPQELKECLDAAKVKLG